MKLAKETILNYIRYGKAISPSKNLPSEMQGQAGVFVSIKKRGRLRGCVGTIEPTQPTLAQEIIQSAISASTKDYRFPPIEVGELDELDVSVDVLTLPEKISSPTQLDTKRYGVIVQKGKRRGLLLPDQEGVATVGDQIAFAKQKAGIKENEEGVGLFRFEVKRYK